MTLGTQILTIREQNLSELSFQRLSVELTENALDGILTQQHYDEILTALLPIAQTRDEYLEAYLRLVHEGQLAWQEKHLALWVHP